MHMYAKFELIASYHASALAVYMLTWVESQVNSYMQGFS
jgi:hypothetical protein